MPCRTQTGFPEIGSYREFPVSTNAFIRMRFPSFSSMAKPSSLPPFFTRKYRRSVPRAVPRSSRGKRSLSPPSTPARRVKTRWGSTTALPRRMLQRRYAPSTARMLLRSLPPSVTEAMVPISPIQSSTFKAAPNGEKTVRTKATAQDIAPRQMRSTDGFPRRLRPVSQSVQPFHTATSRNKRS